jgi:hypothetical protein
MIGWYVHDHGSGHRRRLEAVAAHLAEPVTGMGSGEPAAGVPWLELPPDAVATRAADPVTTDPTAGGTLHWAPLGEPGMLGRAEALARWARASGCRLLVVDVSVEMLLLGRLLGLPTIAVLQPGDRSDPAHVLGYSTAAALLAPWPSAAQGRVRGRFAARTRWTGAFSRYDGRDAVMDRAGCLDGRCVVLALGRGGHGVRAADVRAAADATARAAAGRGSGRGARPGAGVGWHWHVAGELVEGEPVGHDRVVEHGVVPDVWPLLSGADVVVGPCGGGLVAEVSAAGAPFLALPQPRPFDEQVAWAGCCAGHGSRPSPRAGPPPARGRSCSSGWPPTATPPACAGGLERRCGCGARRRRRVRCRGRRSTGPGSPGSPGSPESPESPESLESLDSTASSVSGLAG